MSETICPRHGGIWGDDETCMRCTDLDGNPLPVPTEDDTRTALEELITEQADYNDVYSVDERDVTNVETDEGVSYPLD